MKSSTRFALSPRPRMRGGLLSIALLAAGACDRSPEPATTTGKPPVRSTTIDPANWPQPQWPFAEDAALAHRIDALLATMTGEEKVGQIVQGDISDVTPDDVRKYRLGSILAGGGYDPGKKYNATPQAWLDLADACWEASMDTRSR